MPTLALPKEVDHWPLTTLREKLVKIDLLRFNLSPYLVRSNGKDSAFLSLSPYPHICER